MTDPHTIIALASIISAVGLWLLLPGGGIKSRLLGGLTGVIGLGLFASRIPVVGERLAAGLIAVIALATVVAAVATISCRSPVYCAIWFGMTLVGTAGLFLLDGAEFLAVATIVVYAGAILVTFLFVLMLSQPEGHTTYDRRSWEAPVSAVTGAVLVGILTATISAAVTDGTKLSPGNVNVSRSDDVTSPHLQGQTEEHAAAHAEPYSVAQLGAQLFTRYLLPVEAAGTLLFVALVGAAVIVSQGRAAMKGRNPLPRTGGAAHVS